MSPLHQPNFRNELKEWWTDEIRSENSSFIISFFRYSYEKGWLPQRALFPFYPLGVLFTGCIALLFVNPFPNAAFFSIAVLMLGCLLWLGVEVSFYCRIALIDLLYFALPLGLLAWATLASGFA